MAAKKRRRPARRPKGRPTPAPRLTPLLHEILQALPLGLHLYELKRDGRLVFIGANPAADRILGVRNADFVGRTIEKAFPPLAATEIPARYRDVARTGRAWRVERFAYRHGDIEGAYDVHAFSLGPGRVAVVFADVSARHRAEREIQEAHLRYMALFEEARDAIFIADPATGQILDANREAERLMGRSRTELLGLRQDALHPPELTERCRAIFRDHAASASTTAETFVLARDGRHVPVEIRASVIEFGTDRRVIQGIFRDLTERHEVNARLRAMASEWQATFDAVTDAVCMLDADQRILRCNRAALALLKRPATEVLGRPCHTVFHGAAPPAECPFQRMRESRRRETMEMLRGDRTYRVAVDPLFDAEGNVAGAVHILQDITEAKRILAALRDERDRAQRYLDVAGVILVAIGADGRVARINRRGCEILGGTEAEIVGQDWFDTFVPERQRAEVRDVFGRLMAGEIEPVEYFENAVRTRRGNERLIAWYNTLLRDETGRIAGTLSSGEDITDRRRSETALVGSESRLRAMLRAAPVGIGVVVNRVFQSVNGRLCDMVGYAEPELRGREARLLYPSDEEHDFVEKEKRDQIAREGIGRVETRWKRKDGTVIDVLLCSAPLDPADLRLGAVFTAMDITDRKRAEGALMEAEARYRDLYDNAPDMHCSVDAGTARIIRCNETLARATGYPKEDLVDRPFLEMYHPDSRGRARDAFRAFVETGEMRDVELQLLRKDGPPIDVALNATAVRDAQGRIQFSRSVLRDITDLKRAEERYLHAQKMETIGRLAGGVAHDFNNLLTIVTGCAEQLMDELADRPGPVGRVRQIRQAADRAADLTRQLLVFSRRQATHPQPLDLNHTLADAVRLLKRLIGEDIRLDTSFAPGAGWVRADPGQLVQVLMNLAVNARDAMPSGGTLRLETDRIDLDEVAAARIPEGRPGAFARITVSDTGGGIPPEMLDRIFDPFFTTKEVGKGTGLGLSTVYGIVRQSGGFIEVESEAGRGTTFRIHLDPVEAPPSAAPDAAFQAPRGGPETVLVAEDEPSVRALLVEVLRGHGYAVIEAETPERALQLAETEKGPLHLLVTDYVMPNMNGRELAQRLLAAHPRLAVLYISGYTDDAGTLTDDPSSGLHFLSKPFTPDALARKVREVLEAGAASEESNG